VLPLNPLWTSVSPSRGAAKATQEETHWGTLEVNMVTTLSCRALSWGPARPPQRLCGY
jgi:hypothetical protein